MYIVCILYVYIYTWYIKSINSKNILCVVYTVYTVFSMWYIVLYVLGCLLVGGLGFNFLGVYGWYSIEAKRTGPTTSEISKSVP